jgi:hypothetical protein
MLLPQSLCLAEKLIWYGKIFTLNVFMSQAWCMPIIPALWRLSQKIMILRYPELHSEFEDDLYRKTLSQETKKEL